MINKTLLALVAILFIFTSSASATTINFAEAMATCEQIRGTSIEAELARENCRLKVQVAVLAEIADQQSTEARALRADIRAQTARIDEIESQATTPQVAQQQTTPQPTTQVAQTGFYGGVAFTVTDDPHLISTDARAMRYQSNWISMTLMGNGVRNWAPNATQVRVGIVNNGVPCGPDVGQGSWCRATGTVGSAWGIQAAYVDLGDSAPVQMWVIDPTQVDTLHFTWETDDNVTLLWLVPHQNGRKVNVPVPGGVVQTPLWQVHPTDLMGCQQIGGSRTGGHVDRFASSRGRRCN
jgi:hypothetical protein